jgi:hypothetical protein
LLGSSLSPSECCGSSDSSLKTPALDLGARS